MTVVLLKEILLFCHALSFKSAIYIEMGLVKRSLKIVFYLFLQHLSWRNHSIGGDEAVLGSFRTGDADINTYAQSPTVGLKYL